MLEPPVLKRMKFYHYVPQRRRPSVELRDRRQSGPWHAQGRHDPEEDG